MYHFPRFSLCSRGVIRTELFQLSPLQSYLGNKSFGALQSYLGIQVDRDDSDGMVPVKHCQAQGGCCCAEVLQNWCPHYQTRLPPMPPHPPLGLVGINFCNVYDPMCGFTTNNNALKLPRVALVRSEAQSAGRTRTQHCLLFDCC